MVARVRIGVSANFFHRDPDRPVFRHKTLQFIEERMALACWRAGALPTMLPDLKHEDGVDEFFDHIEGLILAGGADVSPRSYGEEPLREQWSGDGVRDEYEMRLVRIAAARGVPVLGICRGLQLLNVALGGSLWQDLATQVPGALVHRDWHRYDENGHEIAVAAGSWVSRSYGDATKLDVNSVHHQAVRKLAPLLRPTAWAPDGVVEAAECIDEQRFLVGVQWHPEWLEAEAVAPTGPATGRHEGAAIFSSFVEACRARSSERPRGK